MRITKPWQFISFYKQISFSRWFACVLTFYLHFLGNDTVDNTPVRSWIRLLILTIHLTKITSTKINEYELELKWTENTTIRKNNIK